MLKGADMLKKAGVPFSAYFMQQDFQEKLMKI